MPKLKKIEKFFTGEKIACALIFLLPLYLIRFRLGIFPANVWEFLVWFVLIVWAMGSFSKNKKNFLEKISQNTFLGDKRILVALLALFLFLFVAAFANENQYKSLGIIKSWFLLPVFLAIWVQLVFSGRKKTAIFISYFFSASVVSLVGILFLFWGKTTYDGRLEVFFNSPNYLAMYLVPGAIIGASILKRKKIIPQLLLGSILVALYFSFSYAAWLSLAIALVALQFFKSSPKRLLSIGFILAILFLTFAFQFGKDKFQSNFGLSARSSLSSRLAIWSVSKRMIRDKGLWGIGEANFQQKYLEYQKFYPPYLDWAVSHPHNLFLAFWLFGGAGSLVAFCFLLFFWFSAIRKILIRDGDPVAFLTLGIMLAILAHGFFDTPYFKNDLAVVFWLNFIVISPRNLRVE